MFLIRGLVVMEEDTLQVDILMTVPMMIMIAMIHINLAVMVETETAIETETVVGREMIEHKGIEKLDNVRIGVKMQKQTQLLMT